MRIEKMSKQWTSPAYAFFKPVPVIDYVNGRRCNVFKCFGHGCKFTAHRFLDKGDKSSTGNLIRHPKACWGEDAWKAADACQNADEARKSVTKPQVLNGSITATFKRAGKGIVTYSHTQHTREQTKQVITLLNGLLLISLNFAGRRLCDGLQSVHDLSKLSQIMVFSPL
jgi:hypothetical protein